MVLQALTRYYDILSQDPESGISPPGYSEASISFALILAPTGALLEIIPTLRTVQRGKKINEYPQKMIVPEAVKRSSGIRPNLLWDNCTHVLGISDRDESDEAYAANRHDAFCERNREFLKGVDGETAKAILAFLESWDPKTARDHPAVLRHLDALLKGGNMVFKLDGQAGYAHESPQIREALAEAQANLIPKPRRQCLVTGKMAPIAILHPSLKGIKDANPTGASLVSFNSRAYESYNRNGDQGLNSPVSEEAAFAYTTALNYLLSADRETRSLSLGDATVVYWAESQDITYQSVFQGLIDPAFDVQDASTTQSRDTAAERLLRDIAEKVRQGQALDNEAMESEIDPNTRFYVLGLSPNSARISVRFFYSDPFLKVVQRILQHHQDMSVGQKYPFPFWKMLNETVSPKLNDKTPAPLLAGAVMRAILSGAPYPAALFYAIVNRVCHDQDDEQKGFQKISPIRAGIIKAYLLRKYQNLVRPEIKEVLCMSLNEQSTNQAYLLGRLFAVLEKAQMEAAAPAKLNATIKDRYFTSACATPSTVFPVLLRLSQHHISKAEYGYATDNRIAKIMALLDVENDPFPRHLSLDEQGIFILGYYHQREAFYQPKSDKITETDPSEN